LNKVTTQINQTGNIILQDPQRKELQHQRTEKQ